MNITITLTDAEAKALGYVAVSPEEWANNAVKERARIAIDEIFNQEVARMAADPNTKQIPADKNQVVLDAKIQSLADKAKAEEALNQQIVS